MVSAIRFFRFILRLVKRKPTKSSSSSSSSGSHISNVTDCNNKQQGDPKVWPETTNTSFSSKGNQPKSGSSRLVIAPHLSNGSPGSSGRSNKSSISAFKHVIGDGPIVFQYKELSRLTDGFSPYQKIGNSVYRGAGRDGMEVAISIHKKGDMYTDFVPKLKILCSLHHSNVIPMIGACSTESGDYVYSVYPFDEGAKLRDCLRNVHSPGFSVLNTWTRRLQVAVDVAKGLEYLHEGTNTPLVHKYVKSSNILVDSKTLRARIAQCGVADLAGEVPPVNHVLSRMGPGVSTITERVDESPRSPIANRRISRSRSRKLSGTRGYMAPEYISSGAVTAKLDIFAFGVVLLELLSGQEAVVYKLDSTGSGNILKRFTLFEAVRAIMEDKEPKAKLRHWMDPLLKDSYPLTLALRVARLGRSCVETNPALRPEMRSVALELSRVLMLSQRWEAGMVASRENMSRSLEAR